MRSNLEEYSTLISSIVSNKEFPVQPENLYQPINYLLSLEGKRMRPILTLMAADMFSEQKDIAANAALSLEVFHNFTLIHDDIMDKAPLRRGAKTIHTKWNQNIAIISGDTLLIDSYFNLSDYPSNLLPKLLKLFNETAIGVCEGQQMDMDFENSDEVTIPDYIEMIRLKTAILLGCSLKIGALVAGANIKDADDLYQFGNNIGLAFQLQDDILDIYAKQAKFGKLVGGDIIANKKTFLLLTAFQDADEKQKVKLFKLLSEEDEGLKVKAVTDLFNQLDVKQKAEIQVKNFFLEAMDHLNSVNVSEDKKDALRNLATQLMSRES
jgi:geranylgeranyl diphosphate synthase type II